VKLIYVERAMVTWLFDTRLINPKGLDIQQLIDGLKNRFRFAKFPAHSHDLHDNALVFEAGSFVNSANTAIGANLKTFSDGIVAETQSNTDDTLEFMRQLGQAILEDGFALPSEGMEQLGFVSQLRVESETPLLPINPKLASLARFLEIHLSSLDGKTRAFEVGGIQLLTEDASKPKAPIPFRFERKYGVPFSQNEYFTQAPLQTNEHLELLEELEKILKG